MNILHDPNKKFFLCEGIADKDAFVKEVSLQHGAVASPELVWYGWAIKDKVTYRVLKRPRHEYGHLESDPVEITYTRY